MATQNTGHLDSFSGLCLKGEKNTDVCILAPLKLDVTEYELHSLVTSGLGGDCIPQFRIARRIVLYQKPEHKLPVDPGYFHG